MNSSQNVVRFTLETTSGWKGYNETLGEYQGEVIHKTELLSAFERKVERCRSDESVMNEADWVGLRAILQAVFRAFE